jgi:hypothetical protein
MNAYLKWRELNKIKNKMKMPKKHKNPKKTPHLEALRNVFLVGVMISIILFSVSFASALELNPFATKKIYDKELKVDTSEFLREDFNSDYGIIKLSKTAFWFETDKLVEYSLTRNTNECYLNCEAEGRAVLYEDGKLFTGKDFLDKKGKEASMVNTQYWLFEGYETKTREVCVRYDESEDGKGYRSAEIIIEPKCLEYELEKYQEEIWEEYNYEELKSGNYRWKLTGSKEKMEDVDFIPIAKGKELNEWAWWFIGEAEYVYYGGDTNQRVQKRLTSDWSLVASSANYGGAILGIAVDDNYVYFGGTTTQTVRKAFKSNLSTITDSANYGGAIWGIAVDDNYVYFGGENNQTVWKAFKSNLSRVSNSLSYGGSIRSIAVDDNYVYFGGTTTKTVRKAFKSNLSTITNSANYGGAIFGIAVDDDYVYYGGDTTKTVRKAFKSNLSTITDSADYGGSIRSIVLEEQEKNIKLTLNSPINYYNISSRNILFEVNATALNDKSVKNVTIFIKRNGNPFYTNTNTSGISGIYKWNITNLITGNYTWYIEAYDDDDILYTSEVRSFSVDLPEIIILLNAPANNSVFGDDQQIDFVWNVIPHLTTIKEVSFLFSGEVINVNNSGIAGEYSIWIMLGVNGTLNYNWRITAEDTDGNLYYSEIRDFSVTSKAPNLTLISPLQNYSIYTVLPTNIPLNYTISDIYPIDKCWYNTSYDSTLTYVNCSNGTAYFPINVPKGNGGTITYYYYANNTLGNIAGKSISFNIIEQNNVSYTPILPEGSSDNFVLNLTYNTTKYPNVIANLYYNGNRYSTNRNKVGNNTIFSRSLMMPLVNANTNYSFYFEIVGFGNTTLYNQTVTNINFFDCNLGNASTIMNISLWDERNQSLINGSIEYTISIYDKNTNLLLTTSNKSYTNVQRIALCYSPSDLNKSNYYIDGQIRYWTPTHSTENHFFQMSNLASYPKEIKLYDLNISQTTRFKVTYKGNSFIPQRDVVLQLYKKYVNENTYKIVEAPLTSDQGEAILNIDLDNNYYQVIALKNGRVLDFYDNIVFACDQYLYGLCNFNLDGVINPYNEISVDAIRGMVVSFYYDKDTNKITVFYTTDDIYNPSSVNLVVDEFSLLGKSTVYNQTVNSAFGNFEISLNNTDIKVGNKYYVFTLYKDGKLIIQKEFESLEKLTSWNSNNFFIFLILFITIIGMSFSSAEGVVIFGVIGFLVGGLLALVNGINLTIGLGGLIWILIAAGIIIYKISEKEGR